MSIWPYIETTPLYTLNQEMNTILFHLGMFHSYERDFHESAEVEWQYYLTLERRLNSELIWC